VHVIVKSTFVSVFMIKKPKGRVQQVWWRYWTNVFQAS